jgi:hypothetical protein
MTSGIAFYQSKSFNDPNIRRPTAVEIGKAVLCHDKYQPTCTFISRVDAKALLPFLPSGTVHIA